MIDHEDPSWNSVRAHLPDPTIATAAQLETAADILRARRFIADALDYYEFSLRRGGNPIDLLNKMGVSSLELRNLAAARAYFQQVVKLQKKSPEGWNNLGAIEYLTGHYDNAINNYKKAIKYDKASATYHSNLGTAYFEKKDFEAARKQYDTALKIDPDLMQHHSSIGVTARMLSPADHARFCYEMARLYARRGNEDAMIHFLTMASEAGFDVMGQLPFDDSLARYRKDPRVLLLVKNAHDLRTRGIPIASGAAPPLPAEAPTKN
ncbi:MAG: tetratricopeptide repeat protein [Edaphobacter sp.]|uniref:tetratricopeptide repeat protein n=1 Tax=Edaphobacter sp. TaxID=1934404 RepID=UPI00239E2017|nr:tetratricopeptide repeat protein [Edaphobacter sp.]MDE1176113.1 tetratricopeptide repeat protein [Edaphobacter sp.]